MRMLSRLSILSAASLGLMALPAVSMPEPPAAAAQGQGKRSSPSHTTLHKTNGQRERNRRMRQIAAGQLRAENGLSA